MAVSPFESTVILSCKATVGDQQVTSQMAVPAAVWDDPGAREAIEEDLRYKLISEILKKWTPAIKVERG